MAFVGTEKFLNIYVTLRYYILNILPTPCISLFLSLSFPLSFFLFLSLPLSIFLSFSLSQNIFSLKKNFSRSLHRNLLRGLQLVLCSKVWTLIYQLLCPTITNNNNNSLHDNDNFLLDYNGHC